MATLTTEYGKPDSKGNRAVYIRLSHHRKHKRLRMPFMASATDFDRKGNLTNNIMLLSVNKQLNTMMERLINMGYEASRMTPGQLLEALVENPAGEKFDLDFFDYGDRYAQKLTDDGRTATARAYTTALNSFATFLDRRTFNIHDFTLPLLQTYFAWLDESGVGRRGQDMYISTLLTLFERAKREYNDEENDVYLIKGNPFKKLDYHMTRAEQSMIRKRALSPEAIRYIYGLSPLGEKSDEKATIARDMFLLSFCLCGINTIDLYTMEANADRSKIRFYRHKTVRRSGQDSYMEITIPDIIRPIVDKYADPDNKKFFCFYKVAGTSVKFNQLVNTGLKQIAKGCTNGLLPKNLTYYAARHTWSTVAANDCKIPVELVDRCLCHSSRSIAAKSYIRWSYDEVDEANNKVISFTFNTDKQ